MTVWRLDYRELKAIRKRRRSQDGGSNRQRYNRAISTQESEEMQIGEALKGAYEAKKCMAEREYISTVIHVDEINAPSAHCDFVAVDQAGNLSARRDRRQRKCTGTQEKFLEAMQKRVPR